MKEKVNVGIAGLGRSGWDIHAKLLEGLPDKYQVSAVSDPDEKRLLEASDRFNDNYSGERPPGYVGY